MIVISLACENTIVAFGSRISSEWQIFCIISVKIYQRSNSTTYSEELFHKTLFKDFFQGHINWDLLKDAI
jgi:hypothetical protein